MTLLVSFFLLAVACMLRLRAYTVRLKVSDCITNNVYSILLGSTFSQQETDRCSNNLNECVQRDMCAGSP